MMTLTTTSYTLSTSSPDSELRSQTTHFVRTCPARLIELHSLHSNEQQQSTSFILHPLHTGSRVHCMHSLPVHFRKDFLILPQYYDRSSQNSCHVWKSHRVVSKDPQYQDYTMPIHLCRAFGLLV
jgi:hypothetical protein